MPIQSRIRLQFSYITLSSLLHRSRITANLERGSLSVHRPSLHPSSVNMKLKIILLAVALCTPCFALPINQGNISDFAEGLVDITKDPKKGGKDGGLRKMDTCLEIPAKTTVTKCVLFFPEFLRLAELWITRSENETTTCHTCLLECKTDVS
jgi:hypothetical protein